MIRIFVGILFTILSGLAFAQAGAPAEVSSEAPSDAASSASSDPPSSTPAPDEPAGSSFLVMSPANVDKAWRPTGGQIARVKRQTFEYFDARDNGRLKDAYNMFAPAFKDAVTYAAWSASKQSFNSAAGAAVNRWMRKMTWYKDPQGKEGVYAVVDANSEFANLALHCGYVAWQMQPDGSFAIIREEENTVTKAVAAKMKPQELEQARAMYRCQ